MSDKKIVSIRNLCIKYGSGRSAFQALNNVYLDVKKGDIFGIVGESGSGKSTLARGIIGLENISNGQIYFDGCLMNKNIRSIDTIYHDFLMVMKKCKFQFATLNSHLVKFNKNIKLKREFTVASLLALASGIRTAFSKLIAVRYISCDKDVNKLTELVDSSIKLIYATLENLEDINNELKSEILDLGNLAILVSAVNNNLKNNFNFSLSLTFMSEINKINADYKISAKEKYAMKRDLQIVMQDPATSLNERMSIFDIISEGLKNFYNIVVTEEDIADAKKEFLIPQNNNIHKNLVIKHLVYKALNNVGLSSDICYRFQHELSGGQQQRVSIARTLVLKPKLLIADEPISSLDVSIRAQILNLFKKIQSNLDLTYIFIAHDLSVVRHFCQKIAVVYHGNIVEIASSDEIFLNPIHKYTKTLLHSSPIPELDMDIDHKDISNFCENPDDYIFDPRQLREVSPNHFAFLSKKEFENLLDLKK
jgi:oligopeptide transport system ATP-binding protein